MGSAALSNRELWNAEEEEKKKREKWKVLCAQNSRNGI